MYCTRADIEVLFGIANVQQWANLESGDVTDPAVLTAIAARIALAIADGQALVDARLLSGPYEVPFVTVPRIIAKINARLAGVDLYESRGVQDYDEVSGKPHHRLAWHAARAEQDLRDILIGKLHFAVHETCPAVVKEDSEYWVDA